MKSDPVLIAAGLCLAALAYVGSYAWIVKSSEMAFFMCGHDTEPSATVPAFRNEGPARFLYAPVHAVDVRLRPDYWKYNPIGLQAKEVLAGPR